MRQLHAFLDAIHIRNTKKEYYRMQFHAQLKGAEIKPLEEILGVNSGERAFDEQTESELDKRANQMLAEQNKLRKFLKE